jgi:hypothetical protein
MTATAPSGVVTFLFTDVEGSSLGGRRGSDAGGPAEARRGVAHRDRGARRLCVQPHGRWSGCRILFSEICGRRCDRRAAGGWSCRCGWASRPASRAARRRLLRHGAQSRCAGDGCGARRSDPVAESTAGLLSGVDRVDLGPRRLRDLPTPVGVFQVRAPGLRMDFPLNGVVRLRAQTRWPGQWGSAVFATSSMSLSVFSPPCGPGDRCRAGTGLGRCLRPKSYSRATLSAQAWNGLLRLASMMCAPSRLCANCSGSS